MFGPDGRVDPNALVGRGAQRRDRGGGQHADTVAREAHGNGQLPEVTIRVAP